MSVNVRPARPEDADSIAELGDEFVTYLRTLGDPSPVVFIHTPYAKTDSAESPAFSGIVAELDGKVHGYLLYHPGYDIDRGGRVLYVVDLYVREEARRRGMGRALMEAAADIARKSGARGLVWSVYARNLSAIAFYEHLGAQYTMEVKSMYWVEGNLGRLFSTS